MYDAASSIQHFIKRADRQNRTARLNKQILHIKSAVYTEYFPGNIFCGVRQKKCNCRGYVPRRSYFSERNFLFERRKVVFRENIQHIGFNYAGSYTVYSYPRRGDFFCKRFCKTYKPCFCRGICGLAGSARLSPDRRNIYDISVQSDRTE